MCVSYPCNSRLHGLKSPILRADITKLEGSLMPGSFRLLVPKCQCVRQELLPRYQEEEGNREDYYWHSGDLLEGPLVTPFSNIDGKLTSMVSMTREGIGV